jgi:hypothetical protein
MAEDGEIVLPAGTRYVPVADIPTLIALAVYPEPSPELRVDYIRKVALSGLGVSNRTEELTPEDWEFLGDIWRHLPPFGMGMPESNWRAYADAFDAVAGGLKWRMVAFSKGGPLGTAMLRASAEERHADLLQRAIQQGDLATYDHARAPYPRELLGFPKYARVRVDDFSKYAQQFDVRVRVAEAPTEVITDAKWVLANLVTEEAAQSYANYGYAGHSEAEKSATVSRIERNLYNDVLELVRVGAMTPIDPASGCIVDPKSSIEAKWRLTRDDVETFLRFARFDSEGKRDFLLDRKRRQGEGRYNLRQAARMLERGGERYEPLLRRLVSAAESNEIPTYAPGTYQKLHYGANKGEQRAVRDWYEEVYWNDLNSWLEEHERRIRFRFQEPQGQSNTERALDAGAKVAEAELAAEPADSVLSIEANYGTPPDWEQWSEFSHLTARQAVLLMHGLNPHKHPAQGAVPTPPRIRNNTSMKALFHRVAHRVAVAEAEEAGGRTPARWLQWAMSHKWEVEERFCEITRRSSSTGSTDAAVGKSEPREARKDRTLAEKTPRDVLDPAIDEAIAQAGSHDTAAVWLQLRELALAGRPPFTGSVKGGEFAYTDAKNDVRSFNRESLDKRLKRRFKAGGHHPP